VRKTDLGDKWFRVRALMNHCSHINYFNDVFTTFLDHESSRISTKISCFPKTNEEILWSRVMSSCPDLSLSLFLYTLSEGNGKLNILLFRSHMSGFIEWRKKCLTLFSKCFTLWWLTFLNRVYVCVSGGYLQHLSVVFLSAFFALASFARSAEKELKHGSGSVDMHFKLLYGIRKCLLYKFPKRALNVLLIERTQVVSAC